jgi:diguanylate cyclase (GGDEF)-like protein
VSALADKMARANQKYFLVFAVLAAATAAISGTAVNAALRHARHDELTGLCHRTLFLDCVRQAIARTRREGRTVAVLCLDLDRFKEVNDTLGHPIGDLLLKAVAGRLLDNLREVDTAARLGGDEFAIALAGLDEPTGADALARRLLAALAEPYHVDGHEVVVGASIGIAIWPVDGDDPERLLKCADLALYRAKTDGRGTFHFFEKGMDARLQARRALEQDLRRALAEGAFEIHYQPFIDLGSEEPTGFEALLRWNHPERGQVSPADFIPLAEETGLIIPLGEWVLRRACAEAATWPAPLKVAVNLSPAQFRHPELIRVILSALQDSGLDPGRLELEITESVLMQDSEATLATLRQLRELGVRISMDDFGTGYSSLSCLPSFPFDKIKIDQSFVRSLERCPDSAAIVRAVIHLGRSLGMATTAEGVETSDQLAYLQREGCQEVQGFYFSPAVPVGDLAPMLHAGAVSATDRPPAPRARSSIAAPAEDTTPRGEPHDRSDVRAPAGGAGCGSSHSPKRWTTSKPCEA